MAPPKASGGTVQSRLSFPTTKGGASAASARAKKPVVSAIPPSATPSTTRPQPSTAKETALPPKDAVKDHKKSKRPADSEEEEEDDYGFKEDEKSEEEVEEPVEVVPQPPGVVEFEPEVEEISSGPDDEDLDTTKGKAKARGIKELMTDRKFKDGYAVAKTKLAGSLTKSAAKESKATTILRSFDLSYEYGPCVGMTRMERWERASKLGLDPPEIVRMILETEKEDELTDEQVDELLQPVFYGKV